MLSTLLHHPRKLWLRRALFQVHLWLGVLLSLYVFVIGLSGSILVFQDEIRQAALPAVSFDPAHIAPVDSVIAQARRAFPNQQITYIAQPQPSSPWWAIYLQNANGRSDLAYAHPVTGAPYTHRGRLFIDFVLDLHIFLLAGPKGFIVNCIAGIGLLILALTGLVLWWPGVKLWTRGFFISLRHRWKRINYDAHNAVGIWTLLIVSWWGLTAVYFLMPEKVAAVVNVVSPLEGMKEPEPPKAASAASTAVAPLANILATARTTSTGTLEGFSLPPKAGDNVTVYMDRGAAGDFSHRDILTFDGHSGKLLTLWHYGENRSIGDWFLWLMYPLHFGTLWGTTVKVVWALLGFSLPVLSITGVLMYWNRYLHSRWRALRG
jgi:uncharacterized iron-regulated membrane protein